MRLKHLPSKKLSIFFLSLAVVAVLVIVLAPSGKNSARVLRNKNEVAISDDELRVLIEKDSDEDGLYDWEESLWGTDPYVKDSNGDGVTDFYEISGERAATLGYTDTSVEELSATEKFSREFFATIAALNEAGELNEESLARLADNFALNIDASPMGDIYGGDQIRTAEDAEETFSEYYENMRGVISASVGTLGDEIIAFATLLETSDPIYKDILRTQEKVYLAFSEDLMNVTVPVSLAENHIAFANNMGKVGGSLIAMAGTVEDPLTGLIGFQQYRRYSDESVVHLDKIGKEMKKWGVID